MPEWNDTTRYSRDQQDRKPNCWTIEAGTGRSTLRVSVLSNHMGYPDDWIVHCYELGIKEEQIGKKSEMDEAAAKERAIKLVQRVAARLAASAQALSAQPESEPQNTEAAGNALQRPGR